MFDKSADFDLGTPVLLFVVLIECVLCVCSVGGVECVGVFLDEVVFFELCEVFEYGGVCEVDSSCYCPCRVAGVRVSDEDFECLVGVVGEEVNHG